MSKDLPGVRHLYRYDGPVFRFGKFVGKIKAETWAESESKALSNIAYQFKIKHNYEPWALVQLLPAQLTKGEK